MNICKVFLDPSSVVAKTDDRLFGSFIEHLGRAVYGGIYEPGSPLSDGKGFRTDTAALVKELGVSVVRYPGGNFVSGYNWEDGIGPVASRPRRLDLAWNSTESNRFGLNEFMDWTRLSGTSPMMTVNLGTRGAAEAKDMVEYCNHSSGTYLSDLRISHGYKEPHGIKLWCLGNEMDGEWQICHKTAPEYARLACETAKLMKWVDPSIELVACGSSSKGMKTFGTWEKTVLEECYDYIDYLSLHTYYGAYSSPGEFLANSVPFGAFIDEVVAICDGVGAKKGSSKKINLSFDEWNVWYHSNGETHEPWAEAPSLLEDVYDFGDALLVASLLISLLNRCDRVKIACLAQLVNVIAPIMTSKTGAWRQTTYYPFEAVSRYGRGQVLKAEVVAPEYHTVSFGDVPATDFAAVDNGDTLSVFVVNKLAVPVTLECDLHVYEGCKVSGCSRLVSDDFKAVNTEADPDRVKFVPGEAVLDSGCLSCRLSPYSFTVITLNK